MRARAGCLISRSASHLARSAPNTGFTVHDRTQAYSPRVVLAEFCLLLLWMGPADMANVVPASEAIQMIYNWLTSAKDRYGGRSDRDQFCRVVVRACRGRPVWGGLSRGRASWSRLRWRSP